MLPGVEETLVRIVTDRFPNISAIHVREALTTVERILDVINDAIQLTSLITLAAGILVLGGAIAAGHHRRVYDAVVLKVLGATRGMIAMAFLIEHGLLGALSALIASAAGSLAAYFIVTRLMKIDWVFLPVPLLWTVALASVLTLVMGFAGTWRALGAKAAPYLRNE
jgi:putative ABC transport system permease protein